MTRVTVGTKCVILEPGGDESLAKFRLNLRHRLGTRNTSQHLRLALWIAAQLSPEQCAAALDEYLVATGSKQPAV